MEFSNSQPPHIVMVPSPGMGHLIPLVEFAKLLHFNHHFTVSFLLPTSTPPTSSQTSFLSTLPPAISYTFLPPVNTSLLPPNTSHGVIINFIHSHSLNSFRSALCSLSNVVAIVTDLFGTNYFDVARELGILPYMYFTSNAFYLSFLFHLPELDRTVSFRYQDMEDPVVLPGCVPLYGKDFDQPALDRQSEGYKLELYHVQRYKLFEGIFVNSFFDLEPGALNGLQSEGLNRTSIYPVGPIIRSGSGDSEKELECISWLDRQPPGSVLIVSFGSGGTLSFEQINELAIGLEKSGQRFLWVVRNPDNMSSCGSFFSSGQSQDEGSFGFLPKGYVDRIKGRGLLVPFWAPQVKVLAHRSTSGFLTHCGWNSILESIVYGVPLIAWPLYAEQRMNAVMLNEGLGVALRPKGNGCGLIEADEIAKVVNDLMGGEDGKKARGMMKELSDAAKKAKSESGYSTKMLNEVALKWSQLST
ncbi:hypothetical protein BVRB_1g003430 [Beta vulgaris subsp. vulgaris]|nr:hypothetical protein BVRB_1g003430 [Beta vulgaris subsp. vulgaris]